MIIVDYINITMEIMTPKILKKNIVRFIFKHYFSKIFNC